MISDSLTSALKEVVAASPYQPNLQKVINTQNFSPFPQELFTNENTSARKVNSESQTTLVSKDIIQSDKIISLESDLQHSINAANENNLNLIDTVPYLNRHIAE